MKRISAHYIYFPSEKTYKLHYVELGDDNRFKGVFPLEKEISGTAFFTGILILLKEDISPSVLMDELRELNKSYINKTIFELLDQLSFSKLKEAEEVFIYLLDGIDLLTTKFGTNNRSRDSYIQRL